MEEEELKTLTIEHELRHFLSISKDHCDLEKLLVKFKQYAKVPLFPKLIEKCCTITAVQKSKQVKLKEGLSALPKYVPKAQTLSILQILLDSL